MVFRETTRQRKQYLASLVWELILMYFGLDSCDEQAILSCFDFDR